MSMIDIQQRMLRMERGRRDQLPGMFKFITPEMQEGSPPDLSQPGWHKHLEPLVQGVDLIIVDNISTLCRSGNENDAESWQVVQLWAIQQKSAGRSVVFIHHAGKGGQQRGTSKREDVMDTVIALKRPEDYSAAQGARFEVHFEKARGFSGEEAESFVVQLQEERDQYIWLCDKVAESPYERAVGLLKSGMEQKDVAIDMSVNKSTVSRWAGKAKTDGRL
jgi:putative DNA primase/helicase